MLNRNPRKNATLETVAREAKVHVATAATILNGAKSNTRVSAETRQRVMEVAARLGYRPNRLAQNLRRQRTMTVGLVAGTVENPFFAHMATLCEDFLLDEGYELVMAMDAGRYRDDRTLLETLFARGVDGIIYWNGRETEGRRMVEEGVERPVVMCGYPSPEVDSVGVDFYGGAQMAMDHLIGQGCRRIVYFIPSEATLLETAQMRMRGYEDTMAAHGLEPRVVTYEGTVGDIGHAREAAEALGRSGKAGDAGDAPDALFCFNDLAAVGAMMGLRRAGLRVPDDISVVGYDAIPLAAELDVPLTTVDMPIADVCRTAVAMLMRRFGKDAPEERQNILLTPHLIVRASSGAEPPS